MENRPVGRPDRTLTSEVLAAIGELADNLMLANLENERLEDKLAQLRGQR